MIEADRRAMVATLAAYLRREGARGAVSEIAEERGEPRTTISTRLKRARKDPTIVAEAEALAFDVRESRIDVEPVPAPSGPTVTIEATQHEAALFSSLRERLRAEDIAPEQAGAVSRVKLYQSHQRGADGEPEVVNLSSFELKPGEREGGPEWPVVQRAAPVTVKHDPLPRRAADGYRRAFVFPDIQSGFWRDHHGVLHPTHDEAALSIALQLCREMRPDVVIFIGDNLDFPEFSTKFLRTPSFAQTAQASIDRFARLLAQARAAAGDDAEIVVLEGNHEKRLPTYIATNAEAAFSLRPGGRPDAWPVLSLPNLCGFDDLGVTYCAGYPSERFELTPYIHAVHGTKCGKKGKASRAYSTTDDVSTIFGHDHHAQEHTRMIYPPNGEPREVFSVCFGALCRVDGAVPSAFSGIDAHHEPTSGPMSWTPGCGLVTYQPGGWRAIREHVPIIGGQAAWRDRLFVARETEAA